MVIPQNRQKRCKPNTRSSIMLLRKIFLERFFHGIYHVVLTRWYLSSPLFDVLYLLRRLLSHFWLICLSIMSNRIAFYPFTSSFCRNFNSLCVFTQSCFWNIKKIFKFFYLIMTLDKSLSVLSTFLCIIFVVLLHFIRLGFDLWLGQ